MPANLTPQFHDAEERFKQATTPADKVAALEEMLRVIPKHKGTEKMQADLKKRLSKVRKAAEKKPTSSGQTSPGHVPRQGAGQIVLCGPPNSGKSQLLAELTEAKPEIADYPFTTRLPLAGMTTFEDVQIQLVDTPPLARETFEPWQAALLSQADAAILLFDVHDPLLLEGTEYVLSLLRERQLDLKGQRPLFRILGNKVDLPSGSDNFEVWKELFAGQFQPRAFSVLSVADLDWLRSELFKMLNLIRVYTKRPGAAAERDESPFLLPAGSTALDAAAAIRKDLAEKFRYARVWNDSGLEGRTVERKHELEDRDIVEIHSG